MAGVPLPTCSEGWAIHDPQEGSMVLFLHPVPYGENRKNKLYKLKFLNAYKICNTCWNKNFEKSHVITTLRTFPPFPLQYDDFLIFEKYR